jgi:hypothetical protein
MSELHGHHLERTAHYRTLDMLMEVEFVLERAEWLRTRAQALGHEPPGLNLLETRSELQQLQRAISSLPTGQALQRAETIQAQAHLLLV